MRVNSHRSEQATEGDCKLDTLFSSLPPLSICGVVQHCVPLSAALNIQTAWNWILWTLLLSHSPQQKGEEILYFKEKKKHGQEFVLYTWKVSVWVCKYDIQIPFGAGGQCGPCSGSMNRETLKQWISILGCLSTKTYFNNVIYEKLIISYLSTANLDWRDYSYFYLTTTNDTKDRNMYQYQPKRLWEESTWSGLQQLPLAKGLAQTVFVSKVNMKADWILFRLDFSLFKITFQHDEVMYL